MDTKSFISEMAYDYFTAPTHKNIDRNYTLIDILDEYAKILRKESSLSRRDREHIEYRVNKLLKSLNEEGKSKVQEYVKTNKARVMNINSHAEAKQALIDGKRLRNIRYSENEWLEYKKGQLTTEDTYTHGGFLDEFWKVYQMNLPERWHIVDVI